MGLRIIFLTVTACLVYTFAQNGKTYTIEKENGVEIVHNHKPLWGDKPKIALEKVLEIGGIEAEDKNYIFSRIQCAIMDNDRNYVLLDAHLKNLRFFDSNGKYIKTVGREGSGPGEFVSPNQCWIDKNNNLNVWDGIKKIVQQFPLDISKKHKIQSYPFRPTFVVEIKNLNSGNLVVAETSPAKIIDKTRNRITIYDKQLKIVSGFLNYEQEKQTENQSRLFWYYMPRIAIDQFDDIFVCMWHSNIYEKYNSAGKLLKKFSSNVKYKINHEKWEYINNREGNRIAVDHKNRLWAERSSKFETKDEVDEWIAYLKTMRKSGKTPERKKRENHFEIYDNEGRLLANFKPFGNKVLYLLNIVGDKILLREEDCITLYVYKIVEK